MPDSLKQKADIKYVPVDMFIRFARRSNEMAERALLVARAKDGREFIFSYETSIENEGEFDLTVCDFTPENI